jgi:hypothetical protein
MHAQEVLPVGTHPLALETPHFPDRLHAFVWRNWQLVDVHRLAEVVQTSPENLVKIATAMGLPANGGADASMPGRGYITLIRRNWHLLPYDQLLVLLDKTPQELAFTLREDDFLFVKLGNLKPRCPPLRYEPPTPVVTRRAMQIAQLVQQHFGDLQTAPAEPRFDFVNQLSKLEGVRTEAGRRAVDSEAPLRMVHPYFGLFGDPLRDPTSSPLSDGMLARLADVGVNGLWMHVVLRQLAPGGDAFPEFGDGHTRRLQTLRQLVQQARRFGVGIYLYINEPRAMPRGFFRERAAMAGVQEGEFQSLCTSSPQVRQWLADALTHVFTEVPDLAGVFTITASENLTHCASHAHQEQCPRCAKRGYGEIIAEVNQSIATGVHRANPAARVIAWDWGWNGHGDAADVIALLPESVELMSVSEWALPIVRGGVRTTVGEYSLSAVGPGPRATRHWQLAKAAGHKTVAKVAFNNTWELSSVPFIPVMDLVARHCQRLSAAGVDGKMMSWSLGGYPSPNLQVAQRFAEQPGATVDSVLAAIAQERYGQAAAPAMRLAWAAFSNAFEEFPYGGSVMYHAPQQFGPANLLYLRPTNYASTMVGFPYDHLSGWRGEYPPEVLAGQFALVARGWAEGLEHFEKGLATIAKEHRDTAESDLRVARAVYLHFASVANQIRFIVARDALDRADREGEEREQLLAEIQDLLEREIDLARELYTVARQDSRIGYEASNHYYYVPQDLIEKVINCEYLQQAFRE